LLACLVVAGVGFLGAYYIAAAGSEERKALRRGLEYVRRAPESLYRHMPLGVARVQKPTGGTE
jgi:hypothetical protein